jgi:hypothetical protein
LKRANELFPLITISRERIDRNACQIGRIVSMNRVSFELEEIDTDASWGGRHRYKFSDVTRVDFGGGYEDALARVAAANVGTIRTKRRESASGEGRWGAKRRGE